jgi:hypothetical protein
LFVKVKFGVGAVGVPTEMLCCPVFTTEILWDSPTCPGMFSNVRASGEIATPGSAVPVPVREEEAAPADVVMLSTPLSEAVFVGANCSQMEHDAAYGRLPPHCRFPLGASVKSPVAATLATLMAAPEADRFVSVTDVAPLTLWTGIVPKAVTLGETISPVVAVPDPDSWSTNGSPWEAELKLSVPSCSPALVG